MKVWTLFEKFMDSYQVFIEIEGERGRYRNTPT